MDLPPVPLRGFVYRHSFRQKHRLPLRRKFQPQFPAGIRLAIKPLRHRSRTAHLANPQYFHLILAALGLHPQRISNLNLAGSFGRLSIRFDPPKFTGPPGERPGLEESGSPKPFVDSHDRYHRIPRKDPSQNPINAIPLCSRGLKATAAGAEVVGHRYQVAQVVAQPVELPQDCVTCPGSVLQTSRSVIVCSWVLARGKSYFMGHFDPHIRDAFNQFCFQGGTV
jgi:hypothetical protein